MLGVDDKAPPLIPRTYISQIYNVIVGPLMTISVRYALKEKENVMFQYLMNFIQFC